MKPPISITFYENLISITYHWNFWKIDSPGRRESVSSGRQMVRVRLRARARAGRTPQRGGHQSNLLLLLLTATRPVPENTITIHNHCHFSRRTMHPPKRTTPWTTEEVHTIRNHLSHHTYCQFSCAILPDDWQNIPPNPRAYLSFCKEKKTSLQKRYRRDLHHFDKHA